MGIRQKTATGRQRQTCVGKSGRGDYVLPKDKEKVVQRWIMTYLGYCRDVVPMYWRQNSGAVVVDKRFIRLAWNQYGEPVRGLSDILGMLWDGRLLAIEVKGKRGRLTEYQKDFLERVNEYGGVGVVARSLNDVEQLIKKLRTEKNSHF